mmetsp:Transcript_135824/g.307275  ORF Transcript_135824/g.307275 Transcript_135824/m.307275 type:complete len:138 (+) Transcript_135824:641-1054(+)
MAGGFTGSGAEVLRSPIVGQDWMTTMECSLRCLVRIAKGGLDCHNGVLVALTGPRIAEEPEPWLRDCLGLRAVQIAPPTEKNHGHKWFGCSTPFVRVGFYGSTNFSAHSGLTTRKFGVVACSLLQASRRLGRGLGQR